MAEVKAIISDFGGVLTSPLAGAFAAFEAHSGIPLAELGTGDGRRRPAPGVNPAVRARDGPAVAKPSSCGELAAQLSTQLGREVPGRLR